MEKMDHHSPKENNTARQGSHSNTPPGTSYAQDTEINKQIADDLAEDELSTGTAGADPNGNTRFVEEAKRRKLDEGNADKGI